MTGGKVNEITKIKQMHKAFFEKIDMQKLQEVAKENGLTKNENAKTVIPIIGMDMIGRPTPKMEILSVFMQQNEKLLLTPTNIKNIKKEVLEKKSLKDRYDAARHSFNTFDTKKKWRGTQKALGNFGNRVSNIGTTMQGNISSGLAKIKPHFVRKRAEGGKRKTRKIKARKTRKNVQKKRRQSKKH